MRFALSVVLGLIASGATAESAWTVFSERCLEPIEAGEEPIIDGLTAIPPAWEIDGLDFYRSSSGIGPLAVASNGSRCILWDDRSDLEPVEFKEWALEQLEAGRYVHFDWDGMSHAPITLDSTDWRTPRVRVQLYWYRTGDDIPVFSVEEVKDAT